MIDAERAKVLGALRRWGVHVVLPIVLYVIMALLGKEELSRLVIAILLSCAMLALFFERFGSRIVFLLLSCVVLVFFSEKSYWYTEGYKIHDLVEVYLPCTFVLLWAIGQFRVRSLAALFLCAALYGLMVEGVIVYIVYEDGLWGWFHVSYTSLAWHAIISVMFGWYLLRKLLLRKDLKPLVIACVLFGVFWTVWNINHWIPKPGEQADEILKMPVAEFARYAFLMTLIVAVCHALLGSGWWVKGFKPSLLESLLVLWWLMWWYAGMVVPKPDLRVALLKLPPLLIVTFLALRANQKREEGPTVYEELAGRFDLRRALVLFLMPAAAVVTYWLLWLADPAEKLILWVSWYGIVYLQAWAGWILFVIALVICFVADLRERLESQSDRI